MSGNFCCAVHGDDNFHIASCVYTTITALIIYSAFLDYHFLILDFTR